jgi:hypothetical protein
VEASTRFYDDFVDEIWMPTYVSCKRQDEINFERQGRPDDFEMTHEALTEYTTDYIVVGPLSTELQRATVNMFLDRKEIHISSDAVLVTITPVEISGVRVTDYQSTETAFKPFGYRELPHKAPDPNVVKVQEGGVTYSWPQKSALSSRFGDSPTASVHEWMVKTGDTRSKIQFRLYTGDSSTLGIPSQSSAERGQ